MLILKRAPRVNDDHDEEDEDDDDDDDDDADDDADGDGDGDGGGVVWWVMCHVSDASDVGGAAGVSGADGVGSVWWGGGAAGLVRVAAATGLVSL